MRPSKLRLPESTLVSSMLDESSFSDSGMSPELPMQLMQPNPQV
jgi:hypothetical protein